MTGNYLVLYPLQISATDFAWNSKPNTSSKDIIIVFAVIAVIVGVLLIINSRNTAARGKKTSSGGSAGGRSFFSVFTLHRIARNLGLDNEQTKMLDYVFKSDQVADPQRSINTPDLLDRHFRRAFRFIDQVQGHEIETQHKLGVLFSTRNILENSMLSGMTSTRQIKDDTNFTIVANKDKMDVHLLTAKGDYLEVEAPKNALGSQLKIQRGTKLNVLFFNKSNKGFAFETRVVGYSSRLNHATMQLAHSNQLRFLSQRRYRRRQASISCSLFLVIIEGTGKKQRLIADKRKFQGNIADISVGGCSIKMMSPVQVGARFKIEFLLADMNLAALGQVLRTNRTGTNTIIHIKFLKASQKTMNLINSFVYEYSRE
jgi:c-di-GMP-binding flagellar brake protein YcgR